MTKEMNSEDKIYNKIKSASQKGEKDFPGMDKVWNRVEEKLDNTIVVKKKNTWQKVAIAATVLLSFSIIYHFVSNDEVIGTTNSNGINTENPVIVSSDSVNKIIEKAKEIVVENNTIEKLNPTSPQLHPNTKAIETNPLSASFTPSSTIQVDSVYKFDFNKDKFVLEENNKILTEINKNISNQNDISYRNSAYNSSTINNGYLAPTKKYEAPTKQAKAKNQVAKSPTAAAVSEKSEDIIVIDGVVSDKKELNNLDAEEAQITHYTKPIYIINGTEYTEESLFGKKPTSPYAPLDKQEIISINVIKAADAMKVYGKKGENGVIIIATKDGKPVKK